MHILNVGKNGTFSQNGAVTSSPQEVDDFIQSLLTTNPQRLAVHFHGGLVGEQSGIDTANRMKQQFEMAGAIPLTVVWETDLVTTIRDNLTSINNTTLFQKILHYVIKVAGRRAGLPGAKGGVEWDSPSIEAERATEEPFAELDAAFRQEGITAKSVGTADPNFPRLEKDVEEEFRQRLAADRALTELLQDEAPKTDLLNPDYRQFDREGADAKGIFETLKLAVPLAKIVVRVIRRIWNRRDHGFYATVVEEILRELYLANFAAWVWGGMKTKAHAMFENNNGRPQAELRAGTYLFDRLAQVQAETKLPIYLSGHSAGAIAIAELLDSLGNQTVLRFPSVQLLAPALRNDQFQRTFVSNNRSPAVGNFRCFTMSDDAEKKERLFNPLYTRSLLYFISGVLEPDEVDMPIIGMQRFLFGRAPFDTPDHLAVNAFMDGNTVYSPSPAAAPAGQRTHALKHGDFDNDLPTLESLRYWIER